MSKFKDKYPITDWVLSRDCIQIGDSVVIIEEDQEIFGVVLGFPDPDAKQYFQCLTSSGITRMINFYNLIVYRLSTPKKPVECSCGAKFTSNPNYHLNYCGVSHE